MPAPLGLCHWFFQGVHLSIRPFIHSSICPSVHFSILPFAHSIVHSFWTFQTSDSNAANQWNVAHFSSSQISSRNYTNQMPHSMDLICLAFHLSIFFLILFQILEEKRRKETTTTRRFPQSKRQRRFPRPDPRLNFIPIQYYQGPWKQQSEGPLCLHPLSNKFHRIYIRSNKKNVHS